MDGKSNQFWIVLRLQGFQSQVPLKEAFKEDLTWKHGIPAKREKGVLQMLQWSSQQCAK